jgi:hypothetical protein
MASLEGLSQVKKEKKNFGLKGIETRDLFVA